MLFYLTVIFSCQLAGEITAKAAGIQIPGPVIGMVLLFFILIVRGSVPDEMAKIADGLLSNLSLLFVPAGVGVMVHGNLLGQDWLPLSAALIGSTVATIGITALVMILLRRSLPDRPPRQYGD